MKDVRILYEIDSMHQHTAIDCFDFLKEKFQKNHDLDINLTTCSYRETLETLAEQPYDFLVIHLGRTGGEVYERVEEAKKQSKNPKIITVAESAKWGLQTGCKGDNLTKSHFDILTPIIYEMPYGTNLKALLQHCGYISKEI